MGGGNGTRGRARAGGDEATRGEATPLLIGRTTFTTSNEHRTDVDKKAKIWALTLLAVLVVIFDFGTYLSAAPQIQIFEQIACDRYYRHAGIQAPLQNGTTRPHHPIADTGNIRGPGALDNSTWKDCTIDPVQNEVALVTQLLNTFDQIPSILLAVPFGILADRIGRRPVLLLSIAGGLLEDIFTKLICWFPTVLPLRLVWLTPVLRVLGGGDGVAGSMLFTMVADLFPEDERAEAFYILTAAVLLSDITASPLSAALMQKSPWLPWLIASGLFIVGVIVTVFLLPETLPPTNRGSRDEELAEGSVKGSVAQRLIAFAKTVSKLTSFMFQTSSVSLLLLSFFVASLARQSTAFQLQYVHKRFGWSYARASFLIALRGSVNLVLILFLLPVIAKALRTRLHHTVCSKDLLITRWSAVISTIGCLLVAIAIRPPLMVSGVILLALGNGFAIHTRTLITTYVKPEQVGTLFTAMGMLTAAGALVAGPLLAGMFKWGLSLGGGWMGLPFLAVSTLFALSVAAVMAVRLSSEQAQASGEEERDV